MKRFSIFMILLYVGMTMKASDRHACFITGTVTCEGKGIENVVVTDGIHCVTTDKEGKYQLTSSYGARFVYISTPAGYLTENICTVPQFYQTIDKDTCKCHNFELKKNSKDDTNHLFIVEADVQAGLDKHWALYAPIVKEMNELAEKHSDKEVFGLNCGDIFWDNSQKEYSAYMEQMKKLTYPIYRCIGNHDMDYNGRTHETSFYTYENHFGPRHYSFNKGNAHYIVIDNSFYIGRDYFYIGYCDEHTMKWVEEDLKYVSKGTLLFFITHIPTRLTEGIQPFRYNDDLIGETINAESLHKLLEEYETHFISGHQHYNRNVVFNERQMEHNTAAVSGIWWNGDVCADGTPQGYGVYEVNGNQVKWYYKSYGHSRDYQFRAYPVGTSGKYPTDILANVWNYDKTWKVEWLEDGKVMGEMAQYTGTDPYVEKLCSQNKGKMQSWIGAKRTEHLFHATPKRADADIEVRVTDRFGNLYIQKIK